MFDSDSVVLPSTSVLSHVVDVHCHPTDSPSTITQEALQRLHITLCPMATRTADQSLVRDLAHACPKHVVPGFGYHPWFSHHISIDRATKDVHYRKLLLPTSDQEEIFHALLLQLPEPTPLQDILSTLRSDLEAIPHAMLGEVGVDRSFRVPLDYSATPRKLTPFVIPLEHQLTVLEAQFDLALELGRNVSLHSVKSQQATLDFIDRMAKKHAEKWTSINVDLHSCSFSAQTWLRLEKHHPNVFLSLSTVINSRSPAHKELIAVCASERLLVESDFHDISSCAERTWAMVLTIAEVKGWPVEEEWQDNIAEDDYGVVHRLEKNWEAFQRGRHARAVR